MLLLRNLDKVTIMDIGYIGYVGYLGSRVEG